MTCNPRFGLLVVAIFEALSCSGLHAQHLPIYQAQDRILYAKVKMADEAPLPEFPALEASCGGVAYPLGVADTQGNFRFVLSRGATQFHAGFNSAGAELDASFLASCDFRAKAFGFRSTHVSPTWLREMKDAGTISLGTILLSRAAKAHGDASADPPLPKPALAAYKKGGAELANSKWNEARSEFEKVVALQPASFGAWTGIGLADEALQQWHDAEAAYQKALQLRPKSAGPYLRIASLGAASGNWEQAAQYSEAALGLDPPNLVDGFSLCALANCKLGRMEVAESSARAGLKSENANEYPELWLSLAIAQATNKHYAEAAGSIQNYLRLVPRAGSVPEIKKELAGLQALLPK